MKRKEINLAYEQLVKLYLRLKGYVVSNLIIHSETKGKESGEIDILGIRFPFHNQDDRKVSVHDTLECSKDRIEILIGEVKNVVKLESASFNPGIRSNKKSISKVISWIGCFDEINDSIIAEFEKHLNLHRIEKLNGFSQFFFENKTGRFVFKFVFFCPALEEWNSKGIKYISGNELLDFTWECLNKTNDIETCSRYYNYELWNENEKLVRFFKSQENKITVTTFEEWVTQSK